MSRRTFLSDVPIPVRHKIRELHEGSPDRARVTARDLAARYSLTETMVKQAIK